MSVEKRDDGAGKHRRDGENERCHGGVPEGHTRLEGENSDRAQHLG